MTLSVSGVARGERGGGPLRAAHAEGPGGTRTVDKENCIGIE